MGRAAYTGISILFSALLTAPPADAASGTRTVALHSAVSRYASPGGRRVGSVPAFWQGAPLVLPVIGMRRGWVRVRLPGRPNGSTGWLRRGGLTFGSTPYHIVIDRRRARLGLYRSGRRVLSVPASIGTPAHPTPAGHFFVVFKEPPPGPGYGPFVLVTSAHSRSIGDWAGSGDAIIGIHGPLGGRIGIRLTHGCIRLTLPALRSLRPVPPGTPLDIR